MSATIKSEIIEPMPITSIKEEPISSDEEDNCPPPVEVTATIKSEACAEEDHIPIIPKKKKNLSGMKAHELWTYLHSDVIKFCQHHGLLASSVLCRCGHKMILSYNKKTSDGAMWRCRKSHHYVTVTVRRGTWFERSRLRVSEILWIAYLWVHQYSYKSMLHETDNSSKTVMEWCTCCRDACRAILEYKRDPLGGSINLVEVFECKFFEDKASKKRKKWESTRWVFCGVEQFSTKSVLVIVENRKSKTILDMYDKYILPGTTVFGKVWNAYRQLKKEDFIYLTQERSLTFYDSVNKTEMNTVEELWSAAERRRQTDDNNSHKSEMCSQFCEYIYRKSLSFASDAYLQFLADIAKIYTPHDRIDFTESILPD